MIPELNTDFREMLEALLAEGARFLVVGAHAVAAHGIPRTTGDLDLWVEPTAANAERVWRALLRFGAPIEALQLKQEDLARRDLVVQMGLPPRRIDLLTSISGVDFAGAWEDRVEREVSGLLVQYLGRDALLRNKRTTGRAKDLADLEALSQGDER